MNRTSCLPQALLYLPAELRNRIQKLPQQTREQIQEIRLRTGRPVAITLQGQEELLPHDGTSAVVSAAYLDGVFRSVCEHSVHSYQHEINRGYITIAGGNRVGLCGSAVLQRQQVEGLRHISGINIRIAAQIRGCGEELFHRTLEGDMGGLLICAPPNSGKTTMLRDLCRICGSRYRVSVIDERGELAAMHQGSSPFELGTMTDVFDGYPKAMGIETAVRVMAPQYVVCDEIGGMEETEAILHTVHTGVHLIATAHLGDLRQLSQRPQLQRLIDAGVFRYAVLLGSGAQCGKILTIRRIGQPV